MSYGSVDGLENRAQEAHIEDSIKIQKLKEMENYNSTGICVECDEPIAEARLKRVPNANFCVECQREKEETQTPQFTYKNPYVP